MHNIAIADRFSLLAQLMDLHGENAFKAKSYSSTAFAIENHPVPLAELQEGEIANIRGIGASGAKKVAELLQTGELSALRTLLDKTPTGVLAMLQVKGLGPKKIHTLWKGLSIDSIAALAEACRENRLAQAKGFTERTQEKILEAIDFLQKSEGFFLYKQVEEFAAQVQSRLTEAFPQHRTAPTGAFRRQMETMDRLEWVTTVPVSTLNAFLATEHTAVEEETAEGFNLVAEGLPTLSFQCCTPTDFARRLLETTGSDDFLQTFLPLLGDAHGETEEELFAVAGIPFIPPYRREATVLQPSTGPTTEIVTTDSIKGLIHAHSTWSDGVHTIEAMAEELQRQGFEYLVLTDHSKAASYAGGLTEGRVVQQHLEIDRLNQRLAPFRIFKGIECDILGDGSLDYDDAFLQRFEVVITSIHSQLDMDGDKAMERLMGAITHPSTTFLGHPTGRLLLKRKGYPVDHKALINACAAHNVAIEINASPSRLDLDWRWVEYALEKDVSLSINPDAHSIEHFGYVKYGSLVAQKGGLTIDRNISSFGLQAFEQWLAEMRRAKRLPA